MAKVHRSNIRISGMLDGKVHVQNKGAYIIREAPTTTGPKSEQFIRQQERTVIINRLASEINRIILFYADRHGRKTFYGRLRKLFRREPSDDRFLMLRQLRGVEINEDYPLRKHGGFSTDVKKRKDGIRVVLTVLNNPYDRIPDANCYSYEICVLCWNKTKSPATHSRQLSDWIRFTDKVPVFEFLFPKVAGLTHWMLCVKFKSGLNNRNLDIFPGDGMQIVVVDSFDKAELAMLKEREDANNTGVVVSARSEETEVRVKANRYADDANLADDHG